jgi:3-oxoacyl-[acyl-carrier-protein] synthase III
VATRSSLSFLSAFGAYLPARTVTNAELAPLLNCAPEWISEVSGIEERRYAGEEVTVVDMAVEAARRCLQGSGFDAGQIGLLLVACGSAERQFPGPACQVAHRLGMGPAPALDVPMASAGALFAMTLANQLAPAYANVLVVASEKMSAIAMREPLDKNVSMLFGDGAGACLVRSEAGAARIIDAVLHSDGAFADDLQLRRGGPLQMNGRSVIMQASRKMPAAIQELLERNGTAAREVEVFLMHQANQNLIDRVARALDVGPDKFFSNIRRYGNTSSASMLIAASEWWNRNPPKAGASLCFAAFGAGFHWGALLARTS